MINQTSLTQSIEMGKVRGVFHIKLWLCQGIKIKLQPKSNQTKNKVCLSLGYSLMVLMTQEVIILGIKLVCIFVVTSILSKIVSTFLISRVNCVNTQGPTVSMIIDKQIIYYIIISEHSHRGTPEIRLRQHIMLNFFTYLG